MKPDSNEIRGDIKIFIGRVSPGQFAPGRVVDTLEYGYSLVENSNTGTVDKRQSMRGSLSVFLVFLLSKPLVHAW